MLSRISSKLRSRSGSGNDQVKSFAYGKMEKPDDPWRRFGGTQLLKFSRTGNGEDISFAESIFPVGPSTMKITRPLPIDHKPTDAGGGAADSLSCEEERGSTTSWEPQSLVHEEEINIGSPVLKNYEDAEEEFLGDFEEYFENLSVENVRREQYPTLDVERLVYLDYASCGLYSSYQVQEHMRVLLEEGPCLRLPNTDFSVRSHVADAQDHIFQLLNTDRAAYSIIFTTGFTAGFRLMGDAFPFQKNTPLLVCQDNHEAVRKLINAATSRGARLILAPTGESNLSLQGTELRKLLGQRRGGLNGNGGLFVFPMQSCASGVIHSLNWVAEAQQNRWQVLVDASTYLPTGTLNLSLYQPEFVLCSVPHLLGYPPGIGFLLVRKGIYKEQATSNGQTVKFLPVSVSSEERKGERDCLILDEDNVLDTLSFAAVSSGLAHLEMVGYDAIHKRVRSLVTWLLQTVLSLKHKGDPGPPLARVYGPHSSTNRGNVVAFNLLDSTGSEIPSGLVRSLAERNNILIGGGQLSSPGVTDLLGRPSERVSDISVFDRRGRQFELVRVSLGPMSNFQDVYRFVQFLSHFRDENYLSNEAIEFQEFSQG